MIAGAVHFGRCPYGAECHYMTERQFATMRMVMYFAMGDDVRAAST